MFPDKESENPYAVVVEDLGRHQSGRDRNGHMHQREYTVFIRPRKDGLTIHTMYYANEIPKSPDTEKPKRSETQAGRSETRRATRRGLSQDFKPEQFHGKFRKT